MTRASSWNRVALGAVAVLAVALPSQAASIIVDNTDAGFTVLAGTWSTTSASGQWGTDYRYKSTSDASGLVEWRPTIPVTGTYTVSVWYRSTGTSRPNNAHYVVYSSGAPQDVYVNQQINGSTWVELGSFTMTAGTSGYVTLTSAAQANKTIIADAVKFESCDGSTPQFRAFWADAFHDGYKSTTDIDAMVSRAVAGNYNAIIAEVLAYEDNVGVGHGAYWNSSIVPKASDISGGIDPLAYLLQQAHAAGIEVHCWLVAFRVCSSWPPSGNATIAAHPEWLMVPQANMGGGPATVSGYYTLDPGSPDVQEYLVSIVKELATNYEIDGVHWDYIRYTQTDAGYPADTSYTKSSLARFQQITGYAGTPADGYVPWNDFRRRTIDEIIRRVRAELPLITSNPRQPLRHTAALIPWGDAPASFTSSSAYGIFQNWELWMRMGWLDGGCPMLYYREHNSSQATWYRNWVNAALGWRYNRHMYLGQADYLNSMANSITQLAYSYNQGADGTTNYSYWATADNNLDGTTENDWSWYPYVAANLFNCPAPTPTMPWRNPATATEGTLFGRVTDAVSGLPIDDATVQVGGLSAVQADGNGYYTVTLVPATGAGTAYSVTASKSGYPAAVHSNVIVTAGLVQVENFSLGAVDPPVIAEVSPDPDSATQGTEYVRPLTLIQGTADSWALLIGPGTASVSASGVVSGWTPSAGEVGQLVSFTVRATNGHGSDDESWQVLVEAAPPCVPATLTDFDAYPNGTQVMFRNPRYSGSSSAHLELSPDVSAVTDEVSAYSGTQSCKLSWQFIDTGLDRWARCTTFNVANVPNPTIELDQPVRVRLRAEGPAGESLRVSLGVRETGTTADIGADGGTTGSIEWIGAASAIGYAAQGKLINVDPGVWQTIVFDPAADPIYPFTGDGVLAVGRGTLEHLAFASTGTVGPFVVYVDSVEQICNTSPAAAFDYDSDGDVDLADFGVLLACFNGPNRPPAQAGCATSDTDNDNDVDLSDFSAFLACFNGPSRPPACP